MSLNRGRFSWGRFTEVDLFTDRHDTSTESLFQAIRAASAEEPDADSVLFGHLQGTVVGLRYYKGVVSISKLVLNRGQKNEMPHIDPISKTCVFCFLDR